MAFGSCVLPAYSEMNSGLVIVIHIESHVKDPGESALGSCLRLEETAWSPLQTVRCKSWAIAMSVIQHKGHSILYCYSIDKRNLESSN